MSKSTDPTILTVDEVTSQFTRCSKTQLYRMIKHGQFPPPLQLSAQHVGWDARVVREWIETRALGTRPRGRARTEEL